MCSIWRTSSSLRYNQNIDFEIGKKNASNQYEIVVSNKGNRSIHVSRVETQGSSYAVDKEVSPGCSLSIPVESQSKTQPAGSEHLSEPEKGHERDASILALQLWIKTTRSMDIVAPRNLAIVRHGAEIVERPGIRMLVDSIKPAVKKNRRLAENPCGQPACLGRYPESFALGLKRNLLVPHPLGCGPMGTPKFDRFPQQVG